MRQYAYYFVIICLGLCASCATPQKTIYFSENSPNSSAVYTQNVDRTKELTIQPDDILAIHVTTISSIAEKTPVNIFNDGGTPYNITESNTGSGMQTNGYLVDANGTIDFPVIGKVSV